MLKYELVLNNKQSEVPTVSEIIPNYDPRQFKGKLGSKTSEKGKKSNLGLDFGPFGRNLGPIIFLVAPLPIVRQYPEPPSYVIKKKQLMSQT